MKPPAASIVCMAVLLMVSIASVAHAQTQQRFGNIRITEETVAPDSAVYGYIDHTFSITNQSHENTHRVTLTAPVDSYAGHHRISRLSRTVELAPRSQARVSVLQPAMQMAGSGFSVHIDGRRQRQTFYSTAGSGHGARFGGYTPHESVYVLASQLAMSQPSVSEQTRSYELSFQRHEERSLNRWSRNWLSYSAYAAVVIASEDWEDAPPDLRTALLDYTRAGGVLCVLGRANLPGEADSDAPQRYRHLGFGTIVQIDASQLEYNLAHEPWSDLVDAIVTTHQTLAQRRSINDANTRFAVVDNVNVPVQGLFGLLLIFAVVAGPVNLVVLTRKQRRIWLLWTTPLIALLFCGSVFAFALLSEGVTPTVRLGTVTWLDQDERRSATLGWLAYYAPITPRDGLRFDDRTELSPQYASEFYRESGRARTLDWVGSEQHLATGWVTAGIPSHFRVRRVDVDRRRLQVEQAAGGEPVLINHLDAPIVRIYYMDGDGDLYFAENIEPGDRATGRSALNARRDYNPRSLRERFGDGWTISESEANGLRQEDMLSSLRPGSYAAVLESSPFVDPSLTRYETRRQHSLVIGRLGATDHLAQRPAAEERP